MNHLIRLFKEEEGQAMTEYGLLVGLIAIAVIGALILIGPQLSRIFTRIATALTNAI